MDEIASHCGFTKKTQYCYFDSKDALVASIIEKELLKEKEDFYEILSINLKFYRKNIIYRKKNLLTYLELLFHI